MIAGISKYDFWNPEQVSDWYRKNPHKKNSRSKKISKKSKIFFKPKKFRRENLRKSQWKMTISKFRKFSEKIEILKFSFFIDFSEDFFSENFSKFCNFHFSLTFPKIFLRIFLSRKIVFRFFRHFFWSRTNIIWT